MGGSSAPPTERSALLTSEPAALSTTTVVAYATPALPSSARDIFMMLYLRKFYVDTLGVPPERLAIIDAGVHATHYFTAIFSGVMIDSTNVAFGRRRTHMLIWSIVTALAFAFLFGVPDGGLLSSSGPSPWGWQKVLTYYACLKVVYDVAPLGLTWQALGPELTQRVQERNRLYAVTQSMHWLGNLCGATLPALLIALLSSDQLRLVFGATALIITTLLVGAFVMLVALVAEPKSGAPPCSPFDAVPTLRNAVRNRCFVVMVLLDVMYAISKAFGDGLAVFFVQYYLKLDNEVTWVAASVVLACVVALLVTPLWAWAADRYGRYRIWLLGWLIAAPTGLVNQLVLRPGDPHVGYVWLGAVAWYATFASGTSFLWQVVRSDSLDYAQLRTGLREEGQYLQFWMLSQRFIGIFGNAIPFALLGAVGYVPNTTGDQQQNEDVGRVIGLLVNVMQAVVSLLGLAMAFFLYPMRERHYALVTAGLARHAQGLPAEDPFTGRAIPPPNARPYAALRGDATATSQLEKGQSKPPAPKVIDHFALWELRLLLRVGLHRARWWVRGLLTTYLMAGCALAALTAWLLVGSDVSEVLACFLLIATSLSFTLALLQLLRAVAAPKLAAVGAERIRAHMDTVFF